MPEPSEPVSPVSRPTRTHSDENFPVGSLLIAPALRPAVLAFYAVARATDDIADDPTLMPDEKLRRLDRYDAALDGRLDAPDLAAAMRARHDLGSVGTGHLRQLLKAFRRDAVRPRCEDWTDLTAYCADSANPVGRFLLDLHGEGAPGHRASDALCTALQIINHLQDCRDDFLSLGRVYLPGDWLAAESVTDDDLAAERATPGLRRVLDRCLAGVDGLLAEARPLPHMLRSTRLALEAAVILSLAEALARRLAYRDPLAGRIRLSKPAMLLHAALAVPICLWRRSVSPRPHARQHAA